jgi:hypothetical protein
MSYLSDLFKIKPEIVVKYKVIEVPEARTHLKGGDKEIREVVQTLSSHAGFIWLTDRLSVMNAALTTKLKGERHPDLRQVDFLQAGIYWSNWLKQECARATTKMPEKQVDALAEEEQAFREIDAAIERIG